jgi:hypothetical protein
MWFKSDVEFLLFTGMNLGGGDGIDLFSGLNMSPTASTKQSELDIISSSRPPTDLSFLNNNNPQPNTSNNQFAFDLFYQSSNSSGAQTGMQDNFIASQFHVFTQSSSMPQASMNTFGKNFPSTQLSRAALPQDQMNSNADILSQFSFSNSGPSVFPASPTVVAGLNGRPPTRPTSQVATSSAFDFL